jgi:hypothetical protein
MTGLFMGAYCFTTSSLCATPSKSFLFTVPGDEVANEKELVRQEVGRGYVVNTSLPPQAGTKMNTYSLHG